uniref:Uncharacterized protein n=1 Tax=Anguilla anguilla TaxID=7936 RepID=A0A0E9U347_ANGAN
MPFLYTGLPQTST